MTKLTGLELQRAACEVLGWTDVTIQEDCCVGFPPNSERTHPGQLRRLTEVSEDDFLEWCEKNGWKWFMQSRANCIQLNLRKMDGTEHLVTDGSIPSEARARAIVAAHGAQVR